MPATRVRTRTGLTTRQLLVIILFVAILTMAVRQPADSDTWWHLKSGQLLWQQGQILRTDPFSHTVPGAPWINPGWLVQAVLWPIYGALGLPGLAVLVALVVTATFALVYVQCQGRPFIAALATLLGAICSFVVWAARPQIVSLLLAASVAYLLHRYRQAGSSRWLWPLPLLVALWVNCHAGFVVAFILMGCTLLGEALNHLSTPAGGPRPASRLGPLLLILLACLPAILLNPNTYRMIPYAFQTVSIGVLQDFIQEWASPDFHSIQFHPFVWLLLLTLAALGLAPRRADWSDLALVAAFAYMSLLAVRNVALFAVIAPPILSRYAVAALDELARAPRLSWLQALNPSLPPPRPRRALALLNLALLILVLVAAGARVALAIPTFDEPAAAGVPLPLDAVAYLRQAELPGEMFNSYNWGGYLLWALYPNKPVFVDGRTDLYALNSRVLEDYVTVHWARPGWQAVLDRYGIGHLVIPRGGLLDAALAGAPVWQRTYQDDVAAVYARQEGGP